MSDFLAGDLARSGARELAVAIRDGRVSCVETMSAYLARIDRLNPRFNAIVSLRPRDALLAEAAAKDRALAAARRDGTSVGPLHGLPFAPKDMVDTAGVASTMGSPLFATRVPAADAILAERVRRAGAIVVGKTNVPEFGLGSHTYNQVFGTTVNAFDPTKSAGGSSGGAAVALALDLLPLADGSDFMGSLRNPAGWNAVVGFRPSFGVVPGGPSPDMFYQQFAVEGPMGRDVADCAMLLATLAGPDPRAPLSLDLDPAQFAAPLERDFAGTRVGWLGDLDGYLPMEAGVLDTCRLALDRFAAIGCIVDEAHFDFSMERLWRTWLAIRAFTVAGRLAGPWADPASRALLKPEARWEVERGLGLSAADVQRASVDRTAWHRAFVALFDRFDFLVLPTAQVFPFDASLDWPKSIAGRAMDTYHRWMEVVIGPTLAGAPALAAHAGLGPTGLPIGIQIVGHPRADRAVLEIGYAFEQAGPGRARSALAA